MSLSTPSFVAKFCRPESAATDDCHDQYYDRRPFVEQVRQERQRPKAPGWMCMTPPGIKCDDTKRSKFMTPGIKILMPLKPKKMTQHPQFATRRETKPSVSATLVKVPHCPVSMPTLKVHVLDRSGSLSAVLFVPFLLAQALVPLVPTPRRVLLAWPNRKGWL